MDNQNELLAALQDLVTQLKADRISVADELWTAEDIASYLKLSADTTERRVVTRPDFPAPLQPCLTGKKAAKRWFAGEVISWARVSRAKLPKGRAGRKGGAQ
jgi:hypothetical protein